MSAKFVYFFGRGVAEGQADMRNLLGGKGANLAEMTNLGFPVPAGFTITTEVCTHYYHHEGDFPSDLEAQVNDALKQTEAVMEQRFGDPDDPLLVSVRSGARVSMPGMMESVLNVGLTSATIPGLVQRSGNPRFVYDAYRRLIMMYADVVMEKAAGVAVEEGQGIRRQLEALLEEHKQKHNYRQDTELGAEEWQALVGGFKGRIQEVLGEPFPDDPHDQLWGGIKAVFQSWNGKRAVSYRRIEGIADDWGTAVNVQSMVFGNLGENSATGVAFTRNPATGDNHFYGEWLPNAQGEDVVAGLRTPNPLNDISRSDNSRDHVSLDEYQPELYQELDRIRTKLETHYRDMQDIEFTIQDGVLWMLQTRTGKRNGPAAIQMAVDMVAEKLISREEALLRINPSQLDELLHPMLDPEDEQQATQLARGLPAGPGGATGQVVFTADDAEAWAREGKAVILVREETSPEDVHGMHAARAILTARGGMTSHAALVARGWGKCCIVGCGALDIDIHHKTISVDSHRLREGDWITLNGTRGIVYQGQLGLQEPDPDSNRAYAELLSWADELKTLGVRTNADSPADASQGRQFGAEGIGLCRTEHMFFEPERIAAMRKMILAETEEQRRRAIMELLPYQKDDFVGILASMHGLPVTIRLLDPPLHEFMNLTAAQIRELALELDLPETAIKSRVEALHELNPMLGHRGCRLGIAYPEITEMQVRALFEAAAELTRQGTTVLPEVMIPLVGTAAEFAHQEQIVRQVAGEVMAEQQIQFDYLVGTMIELPRACLTAEGIAAQAEFFSFGTNDLTQTTYGFSRDDIGGFLPDYLEQKILSQDPFQTLDIEGVGQLIRLAVEKGRGVRQDLKIGICGEHGGDPASVEFCHRMGLDYVSCSPFRVPVARLAAAQAALKDKS